MESAFSRGCCRALGSWVKNENKNIHCGLIGEVGVISFNGNKLISTGGGGAIITNRKDIAEIARHLQLPRSLINGNLIMIK